MTEDKDFVIKTIMKAARTGDKGAFGDGKIFVSAGGGSLHHQLRRQGDRRRRVGRGGGMKEVIAVVRMNMMNQTKQALTDAA